MLNKTLQRVSHIVNCLKSGNVEEISFNSYKSNMSIEEFVYRLILTKIGYKMDLSLGYLEPKETNPFSGLSKKEICELLLYGSTTNKRFLSMFVKHFKACGYGTIGNSFIANVRIAYKDISIRRVQKVYKEVR